MKATLMVGMETHLQLRTKSKMFCRCPARFGAPANELTCPVCLGLPGALPVPNRDAMILALTLATALGCEPASTTRFDRKNYFYPDLPKGYQISQFERPLATGGALELETGKRVRLRRLHVEEDAGKSLHGESVSRLDFNRAGTPLVEIVSEPDLASPEEARAYCNALRAIVRYLDISDAKMAEGNLRCEPNVNLHIEQGGRTIKTPVVEIKNINSVRNVERAVRREAQRQLEEYEAMGPAVESLGRRTCGFDDARDQTFVMRGKEEARDYRYFPEPDIPPIRIGKAWRQEAAARVPELPADRRRRFFAEHALSEYDARSLCAERATADYFEELVKAGAPPKAAANWILGELARHAGEGAAGVGGLALPAGRLAGLIELVESGRLARQAAARQVLPRLLAGAADAGRVLAELGLSQVPDAATLLEAAARAVQAHPQAAADCKAGRTKAFGALMGHVMRETGGRANPQTVRDVLHKVLKES